MHQTLYIDVAQLHKQAKRSDTADSAGELVAHSVFDIFALEPVHHIVARCIGAPL